MSRFIAATGILLAVTAALVGCTEEEEPNAGHYEATRVSEQPKSMEWTKTQSYSEAEKTFRAYWALNQFDSDESEDLKYVTGELLEYYESERTSPYEGQVVQVRGQAIVSWFKADEFKFDGEQANLVAGACIDASTLEINVDGDGWKPPREDPKYGIELHFASVGDKMLVAGMSEASPNPCS